MYVTAQTLRDASACRPQVDIFELEWPNGTEVNRASLERAVELGLSLNWFASYFLSATGEESYYPAEQAARKGMHREDFSIEAYFQAIVTALLEAIDKP